MSQGQKVIFEELDCLRRLIHASLLSAINTLSSILDLQGDMVLAFASFRIVSQLHDILIVQKRTLPFNLVPIQFLFVCSLIHFCRVLLLPCYDICTVINKHVPEC